jgi:hypothetical protein
MQEDLGPPSEWQIRRFPSGLREQVVAAAKREGMPVAEFVTALLIVAREAGWPRAVGETGRLIEAAKPPPQTALNDDDTALWVTLACQVAAAPRQRSAVVQAAARAVRLRLSASTLSLPPCS